MRMSRWGKFPHFLFGRKRMDGHLALVSYVPVNPRHKQFPPPVFKGRIKWGDA